ncbi:MAG: Ig domain-containing protein [Burkholderiales bacterium]|nr:Ig domain-containing protein [Burkholderiales bacterium]
MFSLPAMAQETHGLLFDATSGTMYIDENDNRTVDIGIDALYPADGTWTGSAGTLTLNNFSWTTSAPVALQIVPNNSNLTVNLASGSVNSFISTLNGAGYTRGIYGSSLTLTIAGSGTLNAVAGTSTDLGSLGIEARAGFTVNGGTVNATGGTAGGTTANSIGIITANFNLSGGTVNATGGTAPGESRGIEISGSSNVFSLTGGTLTAQGGNSAIFSIPDPTTTLPTGGYTYWTSTTLPYTPTGAGTKSTATAYPHNNNNRYVRIQEGIIPDLTITGGTPGTDYTYTGGNLIITQSGTYTIGMAAGVTTTTDCIYIGTGVTATVTLNDVSIDVSTRPNSVPLGLNSGANLTLDLAANTVNTFKGGDFTGISAQDGTTLTIDGAGTLNATGGADGAGIGGSVQTGGNITIKGGTVNATGGANSAGIGGGQNGAGGAVIITGGTVTATGGSGGAGIGGGAGGTILIYGENTTVTATAGTGGENIGAGNGGAAGSVFVALPQGNLTNGSTNIGNAVQFTSTTNVAATTQFTATLPASFTPSTVTLFNGITTAGRTLSVITTLGAGYVLFNTSTSIYDNTPVTKSGTQLINHGQTVDFVTSPVCQIGSVNYYDIAAALGAVQDSETITMLDDHTYTYNGAALEVDGISITVDLNGYTVNIENQNAGNYAALDVINGGELNLQGSGELNVKGYNGVYANNGGKVTVTNAAGGAHAVMAYNGSEITVTGNATGGNFGVEAQDATVTVAGDVEGDVGINALDNATVTVAGNVEGTSAEAVIAATGATVYIEGTITGDVEVGGTTISAPTSNVQLPPPHNGYYWNEYTDGASYVYKRQGAIPPPIITTASLAGGTMGATYNQTLAATGGTPITWSIDAGSLPDGLILNPATGAITGTPTAAGTFNFTVRAANGGAPDATQTFSITIRAATSSVTSIPTLNSAGLVLLVLLVGGLAFWQRRFGTQG